MTKTEFIAFRATYEQRRKLELLATGEGTSISGVLHRLIELASVKPIKVVREGLALKNQHIDTVPTP